MTRDLNQLALFAAVADTRSFRAAAERLGVTRPAVSQGIARLEAGMGIALVNRTTRSVNLTEDGARLYDEIAPAMRDIEQAMTVAAEQTAEPSGLLRLAVSSIAERFISGPLLASFITAYPRVQIEVTVTDEEFDIVAEGYDAGVRLGEVIEQDMVAVPVSGDQRQVAVATPDYVARHGAPEHPRELTGHRCIGWRPAPGNAPYRWEFEEDGREFDVTVPPTVTSNDMGLMVRVTLAGGGIGFGMEETFRAHIESGALVSLLDDFLPPFPGFFLYFPSRRNMAPKLRALIELARMRRQD